MLSAKTVLVAAAVISTVNAHLFISSPSPIPGSAPKDPLNADGSNFPCHGVTFPGAGGEVMAVGSNQLLSFDTGDGLNTAVHGGGSCQLSITYETNATLIQDPSSWYVIYSIEEGCPTNSPLNLDGSYTGPDGTYSGSYLCNDTMTNGFDCVNQFNFTIPPGVMNGQATLAWTWFNTVGNREMYMNCVAVDITGGADDMTEMDTMPDMFVANLDAAYLGDAATCESEAMTNVAFPNPGAYLYTKTASSRIYVASATSQYPIATPPGCPSNAGSTAIVSAESSSSSTTTSSSSTTLSSSSTIASSTSTSTAASTLQTTSKSATTTTKSTSSSSKKATTTVKSSSTTKKTSTKKTTSTSSKKATTTTKKTTVKTTVKSTAKSSATSTLVISTSSTSSSTASSASASSTCAAGSVACTTFNSFICVDSSHYGICDYNLCAIAQVVAPGTACVDGTIGWA